MTTDTATSHQAHGDAGHGDHAEEHGSHWSDLKYVQLALALAVVTAIEVALSYMVDDLGAAFLPLLLILMAIKFLAVVFYFMHLKFDNRLFGLLFYTGLGLAIFVYIVAMFTFEFFVK